MVQRLETESMMTEKCADSIETKRAFNIVEAASYIGVSRGTFNNWILSGLIPFEELPGRGAGSHKFRLIRRSDLDAFLDRHYHTIEKKEKSKNTRGEIFLLPRTP
jgi:excisionase family DNA binding protein